MNLIKFCVSNKFNKTLSIKNLNFFSSTPQAQEQERAKKTSLFDFHVARGGKIVNFAGYLLPVQYADQGIAQSHVHTRTPGCASIFDVREFFLILFEFKFTLKFFS
jgi:aminomethyltransferase